MSCIVVLCAHAQDWQVTKFNIRQFFLDTNSLNLMLTKFSHCTVFRIWSHHTQMIQPVVIYCKLSKITPPLLLHTTLRQSGEGGLAQMISQSDAYAPTLFLAMLCTTMTITTTATALWKNSSFTERVLWEISGICVNTKLRLCIETICIFNGDRG